MSRINFLFQVLLMLFTATALQLTKLYKTTNFLRGFFFFLMLLFKRAFLLAAGTRISVSGCHMEHKADGDDAGGDLYPARMRPGVMAGTGMSLGLEQC